MVILRRRLSFVELTFIDGKVERLSREKVVTTFDRKSSRLFAELNARLGQRLTSTLATINVNSCQDKVQFFYPSRNPLHTITTSSPDYYPQSPGQRQRNHIHTLEDRH